MARGSATDSATRTGRIYLCRPGEVPFAASLRTPPLSLRCPACATDCPIASGLAPQKFLKDVSSQGVGGRRNPARGASACAPAARRSQRELQAGLQPLVARCGRGSEPQPRRSKTRVRARPSTLAGRHEQGGRGISVLSSREHLNITRVLS